MRKNGVICAIDVNDYDQDVVDLAASFAEQYSADLDLIHVTLFPDPINAAWPAYLGSHNALNADGKRLKKITTNLDSVAIHRHHLSGLPVEQVAGFVRRQKPKLLILGTHARRGISQLLGSLAIKIMRKVECPVIVLRQKQNAQEVANASKNANSTC